LERLRQQQLRYQNWRFVDNSYYYAAPIYRYSYGGSYYTINEYGAGLLREGVNAGYSEGFQAGQADRQDGYAFNPEDSFAYQDASFGYAGYVEQGEYGYYFREGFRRGYEDGFYARYQYGAYNGGRYIISTSILNGILRFDFIH